MRYEEVVDAVNQIISQYTFRLTVRQIYYRLVSPPFQLFPNKLFFVFTDAYVSQGDLIDCDNVQFFLVQPADECEGWFVEKYGRERVVRIDNLEKLPRIALARWKRLFWT